MPCVITKKKNVWLVNRLLIFQGKKRLPLKTVWGEDNKRLTAIVEVSLGVIKKTRKMCQCFSTNIILLYLIAKDRMCRWPLAGWQ